MHGKNSKKRRKMKVVHSEPLKFISVENRSSHCSQMWVQPNVNLTGNSLWWIIPYFLPNFFQFLHNCLFSCSDLIVALQVWQEGCLASKRNAHCIRNLWNVSQWRCEFLRDDIMKSSAWNHDHIYRKRMAFLQYEFLQDDLMYTSTWNDYYIHRKRMVFLLYEFSSAQNLFSCK